jgi:hypothetical protein
MGATAACSSTFRYPAPTGSMFGCDVELMGRYLSRRTRWDTRFVVVAPVESPTRNVTADDVRMFDAALQRSAKVVHEGELA